MKKIVGIIAASALLAGAVSAQDDAGIRFGAWGRSIFSPIGFNGEDMVTQGPQTSWGTPYRVGMSMSGVSEYFGFEANPDFSNDGVGTHDMNYVWCKPFDFLRIEIGQVRDQTLQQNACWGMWNMVRPTTISDESFTFTMLANGDDSQKNEDNGLMLKIDPMEALHIGVFIGVRGGEYNGWNKYGMQKFTDTFAHYSAISAGYKLEGIGQIKLGIWEQNTGTDNDPTSSDGAEDKFWCKIEAAFDLTMVENLYASIGFKIPTGFVYNKYVGDDDMGVSYVAGTPNTTEPFQINLSADYNLMDNFTLHALIGTKIYKYSFYGEEGNKSGFADGTVFAARFGVGADYGLTDDLTLMADFRLATKEWREGQVLADKSTKDGADNLNVPIAFMVGVKKSFSNGDLVVGFEGALNDTFQAMSDSAPGCGGSNGDAADPDTFRFLVPIVLTYWF